ncbi:MAG: metalloregulator ArsR/SmtB family transcription factor [Victivallaceae bacterium]|nr:metalloregulator ArsR/SmtB family transcription factor [Victivallaceae bacterium]
MNTEKAQYLPEDFILSMAGVIKLIGNPQRLRILEYLDINGESTVSDIVAGISGAQGAVSQHLNKLRMAGVVACRRDGRLVLYRIAAENAITILNCMRRRCKMDEPERNY